MWGKQEKQDHTKASDYRTRQMEKSGVERGEKEGKGGESRKERAGGREKEQLRSDGRTIINDGSRVPRR